MNPQETFFELVESVARKRFAEGDTAEETPKFVVFPSSSKFSAPAFVAAPRDPKKVPPLIDALLHDEHVLSVGFVTEGWIVEGDAARNMLRSKLAPRDTPGRTEVIMATYYSRSAAPCMLMIRIEGEGESRRLGETIRFAGDGEGEFLGGRMIDGLGGSAH